MPIEGMNCPSCAVRVTKAVSTIPLVTQPKVNAFAADATLMYDIGTISPDEISQRVTGLTGFTCKFEQDLREEDLTKTLWISIPVKWDDHELPTGVSTKIRKLMENRGNLLEVQYDSTIAQLLGVVAAFELWDGECVPLEQAREPNQALKDLWPFLDKPSSLRSRRFLFSCSRGHLFPNTRSFVVQSPLPAFVQFYIAFPLCRSSFHSLFRQHVIDMELLVAGSTSIAYIYSIISFTSFLASGNLIDESFFETSALLVTLIMVGRTVSAFARRRTTPALDAADALQVRMVNLVENGDVRSTPTELVHVGDIL